MKEERPVDVDPRLVEGLTEDEIVRKNSGLIFERIRAFREDPRDDDLFQECRMAVMRAARAFRADLGWRFATYAGRAVDNQIRVEIRKRRRKRNVNLVFLDEVPTRPVEDRRRRAFEAGHDAEIFLGRLTAEQGWTARALADGARPGDVAGALGITRSALNYRRLGMRESIGPVVSPWS